MNGAKLPGAGAPRRISPLSVSLAARPGRVLSHGLGVGEAEIRDIGRPGGLHDSGMVLLPSELLDHTPAG